MGCANDTIHRYYRNTAGFTTLTPHEVVTMYVYTPLFKASQYAPIEFVGGPPGLLKSRRGTLLTMLLDRIAVIALLEGADAIDGIIPLDWQEKIAT